MNIHCKNNNYLMTYQAIKGDTFIIKIIEFHPDWMWKILVKIIKLTFQLPL